MSCYLSIVTIYAYAPFPRYGDLIMVENCEANFLYPTCRLYIFILVNARIMINFN